MSNNNDIVLAKRDGQTQQERFPEWLDPSRVPADDRNAQQLFDYIYAIAKELKFFDHRNPDPKFINHEGTWQDFLKGFSANPAQLFGQLQQLKQQRSLPAHFSLLFTFLELYKEPQRLLNDVSRRHLDFYYQEVLGLEKNPAVPDKVHVVFELKKNTEPWLVKQDQLLLAGKDATKKELQYKLTHDIVVNSSKIDQLRSVCINPANKNLLHIASVANSADGLGAELDKNNPTWNAFGHPGLPLASVGFCLASDVLLMQEGDRSVNVRLNVNGIADGLDNGTIANLLQVSVTGSKGWTNPKVISPSLAKTTQRDGEFSFTVAFTTEDPAIIAYNADLHGAGFGTDKPVMKILINSSAVHGYNSWKDAGLASATIRVEVKGLANLQLENDLGTLNPKKPFTPFGPTPENNANFWVGSEEAFGKQLTRLQLNVEWKNIPGAKLADHYKGYRTNIDNNNDFSANVSFEDNAGWKVVNEKELLFDNNDATKKNENNISRSFVFTKFDTIQVLRLPFLKIDFLPVLLRRTSGRSIAEEIYDKVDSMLPGWMPALPWMPLYRRNIFRRIIRPEPNTFVNASVRKGFLHFALNQGFLFREYREVFTKQVLDFSKGTASSITPIKEPFSPEAQVMTLDYNATTGLVSFTDDSIDDFINSGIELLHVGPFGQAREHSYLRSQLEFLGSNTVKLLPQFNHEGNFYIGLSGVQANDSVCLLFQVAEGSADPRLDKADLHWSALCDNYWKELSVMDFIFDTTNDFLTSGVIKLIIPREATTDNTIMPGGLTWFKVSIPKSNAVCLLINVHSNAAIAEFTDQGNDPNHLKEPLAPNTISKLKQQAGAIKAITQPYTSFGGRMQENDRAFYTRVSERLRHKERAITSWDYERMILQNFPSVYKVKSINHASPDSFTDEGHTLSVVIPDLTNQFSIDPFQPRVDKNTLDMILQLLKKHSTDWATHHVVNPFYEPVKVSLSVKLKRGFEFNYYQGEINKVLQQFLSPWLAGGTTAIRFGGKVTESHIVKLMEDLGYVDYIENLQLFHSADEGLHFVQVKQYAEVSGPASILVSHTSHDISQS